MTDTAVRLDKWLWAARFFKTRGLAKDAIEGGKVHYDGARAKPSRNVEIGTMLRMRVGFDEKTVEVLALSDKRRGAPEAQLLYRETAESAEKRLAMAAQRKAQNAGLAAPDHKPNKKDRRDIRKMKDSFNA
ncbi:ribosome-associated heat shock protein Hsp15 [Saccharospirillum impatiens]|uniref:ribosome-associated heat shock protein Hsp15 n=1 Tax=Saccharospirillum impatiens TaxID=169438 RepID=UPI00055DB33B|nr:ribosome-associated heat shock protein Hsp15 [Saccharospirillum impatiens]